MDKKTVHNRVRFFGGDGGIRRLTPSAEFDYMSLVSPPSANRHEMDYAVSNTFMRKNVQA